MTGANITPVNKSVMASFLLLLRKAQEGRQPWTVEVRTLARNTVSRLPPTLNDQLAVNRRGVGLAPVKVYKMPMKEIVELEPVTK